MVAVVVEGRGSAEGCRETAVCMEARGLMVAEDLVGAVMAGVSTATSVETGEVVVWEGVRAQVSVETGAVETVWGALAEWGALAVDERTCR